MSLTPIERILGILEKQPGWERQRQFRHVVEVWEKAVSPQIQQQTRPLSLNRQVLWVAASSAAWVQTLSFQRYALLKKLNPLLGEPLVNIRFVTAQWHRHEGVARRVSPTQILAPEPAIEPASTSESAFERWLDGVKMRSQTWPLCPQCQCPTPPVELQRWSICGYCMTRHWQ